MGIIGDGYLSTSYMLDNGEYFLSSDATRVGREMERLLSDLGVTASNKSLKTDTPQKTRSVP